MADASKPDTRPSCFGLARDPDSRQAVTIDRCRACEHVSGCSLLRAARAFDAIVEVVIHLRVGHTRYQSRRILKHLRRKDAKIPDVAARSGRHDATRPRNS